MIIILMQLVRLTEAMEPEKNTTKVAECGGEKSAKTNKTHNTKSVVNGLDIRRGEHNNGKIEEKNVLKMTNIFYMTAERGWM